MRWLKVSRRMCQIHDTTNLFCVKEWKSTFYKILNPGRNLSDNYNSLLERRVSFLNTKDKSVSTIAILIISHPVSKMRDKKSHCFRTCKILILFACPLLLERWWSITNLQGIHLHCGQLEKFHYEQAKISVCKIHQNSNTVPTPSVSLLI